MIDRILVPVDGSPISDNALEYALELAKRMDVPIVLLTVVPQVPHPAFAVGPQSTYSEGDGLRKAFLLDAQVVLERAKVRLSNGGVEPYKALMVEPERERVGDVIVRTAEEEGIGLIVMGTHGRTGLDRLLLGSVAERVAHQASMPVMLVRDARARERNKEPQIKGVPSPASD